MLRESSLATSKSLDLAAITDRGIDPLVPSGPELLDLVDATLGGLKEEQSAAHKAITHDLGPEALVDAAAVFATFEMMNRVADGTGIPMGRGRLASTADVRAAAGVDYLQHE